MKKFRVILFCLFYVSAHSQNLIDNGGFESYTSLPSGAGQWSNAIGWSNCNGSGSPDYCHMNGSGGVQLPSCFFATLYPYEGDGIIGFLLWHGGGIYREYVSHQLTSPLTVGESYSVSFYLTAGQFNGDYGGVGCDQMSVAFSINPPAQPGWNPINVTPKYVMGSIFYDSTWQQITFQFTADSVYDYVTFGNFADDNNTTLQFFQNASIPTSYYFLDGIEILPGSIVPPAAHFQSDDSSFCQSECINFFDQSTNNPISWQWSFPGAIPSSSTLQDPTNICYNTAGTYDVTLIVTNSAGSDTIMLGNFITVNSSPSVSITQNNDTLYSSSGNFYQWYTGGNAISGATNFYYVPSTEDYYSVIVTDANGCAGADTIFFSPFSQTNFSAADSTLCEKFCMNFFDQSGNNPISWDWNFPGGSPSFSTDQNPSNICYNSPGQFDVTLITTTANGTDTLTLHNFITVYVTPPFPTITQVDYTLISSPASSYQWQLNSADIPGATNQSYTILQSGYYTVIVGDSNGCKNSTTTYVLISGIDDVNDEGDISIYPNPSSGSFTIELPNEMCGGEISIYVMNTLGQKVFSSRQSRSAGTSLDYKEDIDLSKEARGIYFVEIKTENIFVIKKITITK